MEVCDGRSEHADRAAWLHRRTAKTEWAGDSPEKDSGQAHVTPALLRGQFGEGFEVFLGGLADDGVGEDRAGRGFVPVERFEVVADKLFVEAGLGFARASRNRPARTGNCRV